MTTLYLDCSMGAAGDMLAAALLELLPDPQDFIARMNGLSIPGVTINAERCVKCGITGTHFRVTVGGVEEGEPHNHHDHDHHHDHGHDHTHGHTHSSMDEIRSIVYALPLPAMVKLDVMSVYEQIADAESAVHGVPVTSIHFHEVGAMDAVADITAVCWLMHLLEPDRVVASPVCVGSGTVRCAHGILSVPAPATARILTGIPTYAGKLEGELCTPTGAALLRHFVTEYTSQPMMAVEKIGYGMGKKDFPQANCLRSLLGSEAEEKSVPTVAELKCNLDDMTGEAIGYAMETLLSQGALDVFTTPITMKKSRPGVLLTVLCREGDAQRMTALLLRHTTTLGVRQSLCTRTTLQRREETVQTPCGPVRRKISEGCGIRRVKYEYDDLAAIAEAQGLSLAEVEAKLP